MAARKRKSKSSPRPRVMIPRTPAQPTTIVVRDTVNVAGRRAPAKRSIVRRVAAPIVAVARRGFRRASGGGAAAGARIRKGVAVASAVIGYMDRPGSPLEATIQKLPKLGGSVKVTMALGLHFLAKKRPGGFIDHAATAMTALAGYDLGRYGFSAGGALQGPGDIARF